MLNWKFFLYIIICLWIYIIWCRRKYYMLIFKIPGQLGYPLIGIAHKIIIKEAILQAFEENEKIYGPFSYTWLGPFPFLVVSDPHIVRDILTSPFCVNKGIVYKALDDGTGVGLFSSNNPEWSMHRRLLNPAFGPKVLFSFLPIFNEEANNLIEIFKLTCGKGEFDLTQTLQEFTLTIATKTTMGANIIQERGSAVENDNLLKCYQCVLENMTEICFEPWLNFKIIRRILGKYSEYEDSKNAVRQFIRKLINEKISSNDDAQCDELKRTKIKNVFINIAIDLYKKRSFSLQNVEDESNVIVFGAFETSANTIGYVLMLLAMFPKYQEKCFEEILSIFPDSGYFEVSYDDVQQMTYMDMVLNESMRLIAPVPLVARKISHDLQLSNGLIIPEGVQVVIDIFHMHRRKDIWGSEASNFNPDNFLPSNMTGKHPYAFIPFTKGIRNCIASLFDENNFIFYNKGGRYGILLAKTTLAKLIRNYRFTTNFKFQNLFFVEDITMKFKEMPKLEIHRRKI